MIARRFHDLHLENLSGTKAWHVRPASVGDLTVLKRRWPSSLLSEMTKRQVDCKQEFDREFGSGCPGDCPSVVFTCGFHQPVPSHCELLLGSGSVMAVPYPMVLLCGREPPRTVLITSVSDSSLIANTLGKYFSLWTVTRAAWTAVLRPGVSGIATDVMLFQQHGARLVYRVYADNLPHNCKSLRGSFMLRLARFTLQASAEARSATKLGQDSCSESAPTLLGHAHRAPHSAPPARRSARAAATVTFTADVSADAPAPARAAPADGLVSPGLLRPILQVSLLLSQSVVLAPGPALAPVTSPAVGFAPQRSPPLPGSRSSTPAYVLLPTDIDAQMSASRGADIAVPPSFETINLPVSQVSKFSSVPLSPSRVHPDFDGTREGQCSLLASSPLPDGHLSPFSSAKPRGLSPIESEWSNELFHSAADSPAIRTPVHDPAPVLSPSLFREKPFDAAAHHPRIGDQQGSCPYTSSRDYEHSNMDSPFGLQVHHPQFLEWVVAPESPRLLGRAPKEWIRVMTRVQTLDAARQLQRDATLMTSNLSVLQQYNLSLHGTASDILQLVVRRHCFPSTAVHDAAPVSRIRHAYTHGRYGSLAPTERPWWSKT